MANTKIANAAAIDACDAVVDRIDGGTGAGVLKIYAGSQPADPDTAVGTQTLLAQITLSDPAFGNATDDAPGGKATANGTLSDTSAAASGTATWFRVETSGGTAVIDGDVGTTTSDDLNLDSANIVPAATVTVSSWTVTMPES